MRSAVRVTIAVIFINMPNIYRVKASLEGYK